MLKYLAAMTKCIVHIVIHFVRHSNLFYDQLFILQATEQLHHFVFTGEHIPLTNSARTEYWQIHFTH